MVELVDLGMLILAVAIGTAMARILTASLCSFLINFPTIMTARTLLKHQQHLHRTLDKLNAHIEQADRRCV